MPGNSIAVSRELVAAGVEKKIADAVAEAIVTYSDDRCATKVDILKLESSLKEEFRALRNQLAAFQAEFLAEFRGETEGCLAEMKALRADIRAEAKKSEKRFYILIALLLLNLFGVYAPILQNLFFA